MDALPIFGRVSKLESKRMPASCTRSTAPSTGGGLDRLLDALQPSATRVSCYDPRMHALRERGPLEISNGL